MSRRQYIPPPREEMKVKIPPFLEDMPKAIQKIYDDINEIINSVNTVIGSGREMDGHLGDLRIIDVPGSSVGQELSTLQWRSSRGWATVAGSIPDQLSGSMPSFNPTYQKYQPLDTSDIFTPTFIGTNPSLALKDNSISITKILDASLIKGGAAFEDVDTKLMTAAAINDKIEASGGGITLTDTEPTQISDFDTSSVILEKDTGKLWWYSDSANKIFFHTKDGETDLAFSIATFSDAISSTSQLIGTGTWKAIAAVSFTASYNNAPGGLTATVALSGSSVAWAGNLSLASATGPTTNTEAIAYPSSATGTITFTLAQSVDGTTDTESVSFKNTIRKGNSTFTISNQTDASIEALAEEGTATSPDESIATNTLVPPATANYLVFAYAERLSSVQQVRGNFGEGQITCAFNTDRESVTPTYQNDAALDNIANSAGFIEPFEAITSKDTGLANGGNDFYFINSGTAQNYIWYGVSVFAGTYSDAELEDLGTNIASNTKGRTFSETPGATEYIVYALPTRLGTVTFTVGGFEGGFESPQTLTNVINEGGFQEDYYIYRSTNLNLGSTEVVVT